MSDSTHTITVRAFDSAYPGSMFDKPHGEYVERGDASSLAAALLELVAKHKRDAEDFEDALKQEKAERDALRAEVERLSGAVIDALPIIDQLRQAATYTVMACSMTEAKNGIRMLNTYDQSVKRHVEALRAALKGGA